MSFDQFIARRYLFSARKTNMINLITGVSIFGLAFGTAALILIMSVLNGFETLIIGMQDKFIPDLLVEPAMGKTFALDTLDYDRIRSHPQVAQANCSLEELAFFRYDDRQEVGYMKGVEKGYETLSGLDTTIIKGEFLLQQEEIRYGVAGLGLSAHLGINLYDQLNPVIVYSPKTGGAGALDRPFRSGILYPSGIFATYQEVDNQYLFAPISFVRNMLDKPGQCSTIELKLRKGAPEGEVVTDLAGILGPGYRIKTRDQQNEATRKIIRLEKWMAYAIFCLALVLVALNLIGTLWMIILDKKRDIAVLKSLGATNRSIQRIFLREGLMICGIGLGSGIALALLVYFLQSQFGIIPIPDDYILDKYPMEFRLADLPAVALAVFLLGLLSIIPPSLKSTAVGTQIREE